MSETAVIKKQENNTKILRVERYKRSQRLHHWVHVIGMLFFFFTGLELFIQMYFVGDYFFTKDIHFIVGIFIGMWDILFFGFIVIRFNKFGELIPTPRDFLDLFIILLCAIRILPDSKYPHYDYYIVDENRYVMKYHPAQKVLSLSNLFAIFIMGATGVALAGNAPAILTDFFGIFTAPLESLSIDIKFVHFLGYLYFVMTTMIHFYFAIIPQNRERLRGMVTGTEHIPLSKSK